MKLYTWPSIVGFANLRNFFAKTEIEQLKKLVKEPVDYYAKVKLHGTNGGIQVHENGEVIAQSRETLLVDGADNYGFVGFVNSRKEELQKLKGFCIFGEWTGKGIQGKVAASQVDKFFAVFAALNLKSEEFITEPRELRKLIGDIPGIYILPWASKSSSRADISVSVDWNASDAELEKIVSSINKEVEAVENCDPWIQATFGVSGTGEGLVFYPVVSVNEKSLKLFETLAFKAKGEQHRVVKSPTAVSVNPEKAASTKEFVELVLTIPRLEQGALATSPTYEKSKTGLFVNWVLADVQKEAQAEMQASNLDWKDVQKPLTEYARKWYLSKT